MQFGNKNNDTQLIAQVLSSRRQPVSGGQIALPQIRGNNNTAPDMSGLYKGTGELLGAGLSNWLGKGFDFDAMKDKYSKPYTTSDMANNSFGGFPSIDYGLPTQNYNKPSWMPQESIIPTSSNMGYGLSLNKMPQFTGFGG